MRFPLSRSAARFAGRPLLVLACCAGLSTHAAPETWTDSGGAAMQAELIGRKGDYVLFQKTDGSKHIMRHERLSPADQARVAAALSGKAPAPDTSAVNVTPSPGNEAMPRLTAALAGKLVAADGKPLPPDALAGTRFVALYYSAGWCPPCRAFTPELVAAYREIKAAHPDFELVFVSRDQNARAMGEYMSAYGMPFPAVRHDQTRMPALGRPPHEDGIPNLVFLAADGRELAASYDRSGGYRGPREALAAIRRHFKM